MILIRNLVLATAIALFSGFASAHYAIDILGRSGNLTAGQWTRFESIENIAGNPYRAALRVRSSGIALAPGEGLVFTAERSENGGRLQAECAYRLTGRMPKAALWSLTAEPESGAVNTGFDDRRTLVSAEAVWDSGGTITVSVAANAQSGNWIAAPASGPFRLALRLYDTPLALNTADFSDSILPKIVQGACR